MAKEKNIIVWSLNGHFLLRHLQGVLYGRHPHHVPEALHGDNHRICNHQRRSQKIANSLRSFRDWFESRWVDCYKRLNRPRILLMNHTYISLIFGALLQLQLLLCISALRTFLVQGAMTILHCLSHMAEGEVMQPWKVTHTNFLPNIYCHPQVTVFIQDEIVIQYIWT